MIAKLMMLIVAAGLIGWTLHRHQMLRSQKRLRELGQRLEAHGINFEQWLAAAHIDQAALRDRRRRDEVQERLITAANRLLKAR